MDIIESTSKVIEECKSINKEFNYFNVICSEQALDQAKEVAKNAKSREKPGKFNGVFISAKDAICVKDVESRAGSAILNGYKPKFDATVVSRLKAQGAIVVGKTSQDAFGFGSFNVNVGNGFKIPLNPVDKKRVTGGSSGGGCGLSKVASFPHIALVESTGGSIACPSSFCGVYGLTPTYGRLSRYGLMDYGSSLDKIGLAARDIKDIALTLEVVSGSDENESTTKDVPVEKYSSFINKEIKGMKIGLVREGFSESVTNEVSKVVRNKISLLENQGAKVEEVSLPKSAKYGIPTYYLLAMAEASTNLALYCGMRYGAFGKLEGDFNDYFSKVRSENFCEESKRRIMLGTFARMSGYRDAYYIRAAKVRTLIINEYKKLFKKYDALVSPSMPMVAPKFPEIEKLTPMQHYQSDLLTVGPNLAGLPHLSVPCKSNLPVGMMLISNHFMEKNLFRLGSV